MTPTRPVAAGPRGRRWASIIAVVLGAVLTTGCAGAQTSAHEARAASVPPGPAQVTAPARARAAPMTRSVPERLTIPAIKVDSRLMPLGLLDNGSLETPPGPFPAGYYTGAPTPGQLGPAIIVGHVRFNTPGVFQRLSDLRRGNKVLISRKDGSTATFEVRQVQHFAKSRFPTKKVYGNLDHPGLRLITCGGLDADTNEFEQNVVVFADLVPTV